MGNKEDLIQLLFEILAGMHQVKMQTGRLDLKGSPVPVKDGLRVAPFVLPVVPVDSDGNIMCATPTTGDSVQKVEVVDATTGAVDTGTEIKNTNEHIRNNLIAQLPASVKAPANLTTTTKGAYYAHQIGVVEATLVGGALANIEMVPAVSGYYGVMKIKKIVSDTTIAGLTMTFQDEDDAPLTGAPFTIGTPVAAGIAYAGIEDMVFYSGVDNKALEVDLGGGAGVEIVVVFYEFWYET